MALIFNQETFDAQLELKKRDGTVEDGQDFENALRELNFEVNQFTNFTYEQIMQQIRIYAVKDCSNYSCILVMIMTHGYLNHVYASDKAFSTDELWSPFLPKKPKNSTNTIMERNPAIKWIGKPKLFFIQACRGDYKDPGVVSDQIDHPQNGTITIPLTADILIMNSTFKDHVAYRNGQDKTPFVQALSEQLTNRQSQDLMTILTHVSEKVAKGTSTSHENATLHGKKQMCTIFSTLRKLFFINNDNECM